MWWWFGVVCVGDGDAGEVDKGFGDVWEDEG